MFTYAERHFSSGADARRAALLARAGHRRPAAVHRGAADLPLRPGPAVRQAAATRPAGGLVRGRRRLPLPPAGLERADHAPRQVPGRSSSPSGSGRGRARARAGAGSRAARGASGRPASWSATEAARAGAATATSCGSAAATTARRRAATATRSSCAGAGTTARRPRALRGGAATSGVTGKPGALAIGSRGRRGRARPRSAGQDLAQRLVE